MLAILHCQHHDAANIKQSSTLCPVPTHVDVKILFKLPFVTPTAKTWAPRTLQSPAPTEALTTLPIPNGGL